MTRDPALYAELVTTCREWGLTPVSLWPGDRIPDRVGLILTSPGEAARIAHPHVLGVEADGDRASLRAAVAGALERPDGTGELIVGIDPGPRPGFAVLAGPTCLVEGTLGRPEEAAELGEHLVERFPGRPLRFRVGSGDRTSRTRIVNALWGLHRPIEMVNERGTTPRGHRRPRDPVSARRIAGSPGRPVEGPSPLHVTEGEVANLQRLSREDSGGRYTIPRALANRVLLGQLTLSEAIAAEGRGLTDRDARGRRPAPGCSADVPVRADPPPTGVGRRAQP